MLRDSDDAKWTYSDHTAAKHAVLSRYIKAWLSILGRGAKRSGHGARLVIVDGFAGRGRYVGGEPGSPLIFHQIATQLVADGLADEVHLFLIEADAANHRRLADEVAAAPRVPGVVCRTAHEEFATAAPMILEWLGRQPRPSFWFIDPFGFAGVPLDLVRQILERRPSEVFITFMSKHLNRFLDEPNHLKAAEVLLGLSGEDLARSVAAVKESDQRGLALRDLYSGRLHDEAGATFIWTFRVASAGEGDTVYYLMHGSTHIKAFRKMKDATFKVGGWRHAFLGRDDYTVTEQAELPIFETDLSDLKLRLLQVFAGRELAFDPPGEEGGLLNGAYPDPRFHYWIETHFRKALSELVSEGRVTKTPMDTKSQRGLQGRDRLRFPGATQASF